MSASAASSDLAALLAQTNPAGAHVVDDATAQLIIARLLLELASVGPTLPDALVELVGRACISIGVQGGDARKPLEDAIAERAPQQVTLLLRQILAPEVGSDKQAAIASFLGAAPTPRLSNTPPPEGSVRAGPLSRFTLKDK